MMIDNSSDVLANPVNSQSHSSRSHPLGGLNASAISKADLSPDAVSMLMTPREGDHQLYEEGVCGALSPRLPENYFPVSTSHQNPQLM